MKPFSKDTQQALLDYMKVASRIGSQSEELRHSMEYVDREYARENNLTKEHREKKIRARAGDKKILPDLSVPVMFPQTESTWAYLCGVFLTGYPIFATVASPENMEAADQLDAVNSQHQIKGLWASNLAMAMRDGLKYNTMCVEVEWETKRTYGLQRNDRNELEAKPTQWEGNVIRRRDLYNTFWDKRVPISQVHEKGEFAGYHEIISRVALKQLLVDLDPEWKLKNDKQACEAPPGDRRYFVPDIVPDKFKIDPQRTDFNWLAWATNGSQNDKRIEYRDYYEKTVVYARIIPDDFEIDVPAKNTPQIWKFIFINSSVLIYAQRMTNAHNYLPMVFGVPYDDGLDYQTKSYAENLIDTQDMTSALWNIRIASARRNVGDRMLYDPRFIRPEDINSSNPAAKIPIRPNAYLDDLRKAVFPFPFNDASSESVIRDSQQIMEFGRSISGVSRPAEGQFLKGNRTLGEYNDVRDNGQARQQMMALMLEVNFFTVVKEIIKYNVMQFLKPGAIYYSVKKKRVEINPQTIIDAALDFKMSDGLLSSAKLVDSDFLTMFMQLIPQSPELQARYDPVKLVNYLAQIRNVPGLDAFERELSAAPMNMIPGTAENAAAVAQAQNVPPPPAAPNMTTPRA